MADSYTQDGRPGRITTTLGADVLLLLTLNAEERLSQPFTAICEVFSATPQALHTILGTQVSIEFADDSTFQQRWFSGVLWSYEELYASARGQHYRLTLRPNIDFLTLNRRSRIFQQQSVVDIVKSILGDLSFDAQLNGSYSPLDYCVQYQESDWAFVSRLMEYEGIYYYFDHAKDVDKIVLIDDRNTHTDLDPASVEVRASSERTGDAAAWNVVERRAIGPAKVTVDDYDFEAPTTALLRSKAAAKVLGSPSESSGASGEGSPGSWADTAEVYAFPAKFGSTTTAAGDRYSTVWLDAQRQGMARTSADARLFAAATGRRLTLTFPEGVSSEHLIVATSHRYESPPYESGGDETAFVRLVTLELMPAADQFRPALTTPRPRIAGAQTALVVGPSGDEIHTDKYGRIKVQFPWDRDGQKNEQSSCFIRVVQSAAGQNWGSFSLPRIGQEVVVEFLDGDPDRPLVTGAVYNATNMVPETLPDNRTQFGMKSRISVGGGGFNRLWFEDKKGSEVVWFRAERDYKVNIVNQDETRDYDKGNRTTTFKEGNDELAIDKGNLTTTISQGDETRSINTGKRTTTIKMDETLEVTQGNRATTIKVGNDNLTVSLGNVEIKVDVGSHKTEATTGIELTCGASKIKMDPTSISLESVMIKLNAQALAEIKGALIQSDASAMQIVKGGVVMIN